MLLHSVAEFQKYCWSRYGKLSVKVFVFESCRHSSSYRKNGAALKTLNKQNKSLFGDLLETKPERRKRIAKFLPVSSKLLGNVQQDWISEIKWSERNGSCKMLCNRKSQSDLKVVGDSFLLNTSRNKAEPEISSSIPRTVESEPPENTLGEQGPQITNKASTQCSVSNKDVINPQVFQLPDIIVRNVPSFPLQNDKKQWLTDHSIGSILSLSHGAEVDKESQVYPSVSKILNATMSEGSKVALARWRQKMIAELGPDEFLRYYRGLLTKGSLFHATIQRYLTRLPQEQLQLDPAVEGCWHSLSSVIPEISNVYALESHVVHSRLKYRGVIDCVAQYQNKPVMIEWKKSDTQKPEIGKTYDAPMQLVAYLGAMNYDERYSFQVKGGLVVVAYSDGSPAHVFPLNVADCNKYWRLWLARVQQYWQLPTESRTTSEQNVG